MKRYKSFLLIGIVGALFAACDKELKQNTVLNVDVLSDNTIQFDGHTVTVPKGKPVTFTISGDPDFITFFSGETGKEYKYHNRTEMTADDVVECNLSFKSWAQYGKAENILSMYITDSFPGLAKNDFEADSILVERQRRTALQHRLKTISWQTNHNRYLLQRSGQYKDTVEVLFHRYADK